MHYYQFNIGDYSSHTRHLSLFEDLAYRRLLDEYYLHERPFNECATTVARQIGMLEHAEAVKYVLENYFQLTEEGWANKRAEEVIAAFKAKSESASRAGKASAERRLNDRLTDVQPTNNHKPITKNQEPLIKTKTHRGTRLPADMILSDDWALFCKKERQDLTPNEVFLEFKDYWVAQPGQKGIKTDWDATWRNWVRRQNAKKKGSVWDENERRKQALADRIFGKGRDDGRTIEAATVRLG